MASMRGGMAAAKSWSHASRIDLASAISLAASAWFVTCFLPAPSPSPCAPPPPAPPASRSPAPATKSTGLLQAITGCNKNAACVPADIK
eukprot:6121131-Pyramimonas_sp.AAC.1